MVIHGIIVFVFSLIFFVLSFLFFCAYFSYKKTKSKEDVLICEKHFLYMVIYGFFLLKTVLGFFEVPSEDKSEEYVKDLTSTTLFTIQNYVFNVSILGIFILKFFSSIENYIMFKRPNHMFNSIIYKYATKPYYEIILLLLCSGYFLYDFLYEEEGKKRPFFLVGQENIPFFVNNKLWMILGVFPFFSIIVSAIERRLFSHFSFKTKGKILTHISRSIFISFMFFIFSVIQIGEKFIKESYINYLNYYYMFNNYFAIFITLLDFIIDLAILGNSSFCAIKLSDTSIGDLATKFRTKEESNVSTANNPNTTISTVTMGDNLLKGNENTQANITIQNNITNPLLASYKNDLYFEDYHLDYYDTLINIAIMSMLKVYKSPSYGQNANPDLTATMDRPLNVDTEMKTANTFTFKRSQSKDDYNEFSDVFNYLQSDFLSNSYTTLDVDVTSMYSEEIVEVLRSKALDLRKIKSSLYSHVSPKGEFYSIIGANVSEEYFKNLHNLIVKTYDKQYIMDIYHCSDGYSSVQSVDEVMKRYFKYINEASGTFLPVVVGVFKVKINDFQSMMIFISRNSLVENAPKKFYNYWQMVRFGENKANKISSSKYKNNTVINDDFLFERDFEIETENTNNNKISIRNFSDFDDTLTKDLAFLRHIHSKQFTLLMMYYEFENVKNGSIAQKKDNINIADVPFSSINSNFLESQREGIDVNTGNLNFNNVLNNVDDMSKIGGTLMSIKNFEGNNLFDYSEQIAITGYEGSYDQFKCMCFFMFENPFAEGGGMKMTNFYNKFKNKVVSYFVEYK